MTAEEREHLEEAHGLWELAIVRMAALAEAGKTGKQLAAAIEDERRTFRRWLTVSNAITEPKALDVARVPK